MDVLPASSASPTELCRAASEAVGAYAVLDTPREPRFDRIARLAAKVTGAPIAMITLADDDHMRVKACHGADLGDVAADVAFCPHALALDEVLVIEDARLDPRFADNPYVAHAPFVRFYAGAPLRNAEGVALGVICVLDPAPRRPSAEDLAALRDLAAGVVAELELTRATRRLGARLTALEAARKEVEESRDWLEEFLSTTSDVSWETDAALRLKPVRGPAELLRDLRHLVGLTLVEVADIGGSADAAGRVRVDTTARQCFRQLEFQAQTPAGGVLWLEASGKPVFAPDGRFMGYRGLIRDITSRKLADGDVRRQAEEDPLTGLANRRVLERRLSEAADTDASAALLLLDVDHFKAVNDTYGHDIGDLLIQAIGRRITENIRHGDTLARIGGDEFAVILRGAPKDQVGRIAARLCQAVSAPFELAGLVLNVSLSAGGAMVSKAAGAPDGVVSLADHALYASKRAGRARWTLHEAA